MQCRLCHEILPGFCFTCETTRQYGIRAGHRTECKDCYKKRFSTKYHGRDIKFDAEKDRARLIELARELYPWYFRAGYYWYLISFNIRGNRSWYVGRADAHRIIKRKKEHWNMEVGATVDAMKMCREYQHWCNLMEENSEQMSLFRPEKATFEFRVFPVEDECEGSCCENAMYHELHRLKEECPDMDVLNRNEPPIVSPGSKREGGE